MNQEEYYQKNADLFSKWKIERPAYSEGGCLFTEDGIMDFNLWSNTFPKILILLKENHDSSYDPIDGLTIDRKPFSLNIARWQHVIKSAFDNPAISISYDNIILPSTIHDIAIVDIKKVNEGMSSSNPNDIDKYAFNDKAFIKEQIDLINPDIILCGNTGDYYANHFYLNDNWEELISISKCKCFKDNQRLIIDFYHPSTRSAERDRELFDILYRMILEGDVYKKMGWI
jgi:hypothetical protein